MDLEVGRFCTNRGVLVRSLLCEELVLQVRYIWPGNSTFAQVSMGQSVTITTCSHSHRVLGLGIREAEGSGLPGAFHAFKAGAEMGVGEASG